MTTEMHTQPINHRYIHGPLVTDLVARLQNTRGIFKTVPCIAKSLGNLRCVSFFAF